MMNLEKEIRQQPEVLAKIKENNIDTIRALVAEIKARGLNHVYFAARGTSDHASIYAQYLLGIYAGIPCSLATPSVVSKYGAKINLKNSVVIGVSQSGKAEDVLSVMRQAKEDGTIVVAVTNEAESSMAKEAMYHLYCGAGKETSIAATKTFTSQMYLLALLCAEWSGSSELSALLDKVPGGAAKLLDTMPSQIDRIVARYRYLTDAVVLARGINYPIALEGALKILETTRVRMKGYAISDFYHGPLAQVSENSLSFVIAAEGPMLEDAIAMVEKLNSIGAEVIVLTDSDKAAGLSPFTLKIPALGSDVVSPYLFAMTMQLFAMKLTQIKGLDPDVSPVLNKVTITK